MKIQCRASRGLAVLLGVTTVLVWLALLASGLPTIMQVILSLLIVVYTVCWAQYLRHPSVVEWLPSAGVWQLTTRSGDQYSAILMSDSCVFVYCTILNFKLDDVGFWQRCLYAALGHTTVVITPDNLSPEMHRQLRQWLITRKI